MNPDEVAQLQADLIKQLSNMAVSLGGDPDVYSAQLNEQLAAAVAMVAPDPAAASLPSQPDSDQPDSDQPDSDTAQPASDDAPDTADRQPPDRY